MITLAATETLRGKAGTGAVITYTISGDEVGTADTFKTIAQGQLANTTGLLYTVPASTQTLIKTIHLNNTSASNVTGIVFYIGGTGATNQIMALSIPANGSATYGDGEWMIYDASGVRQYVGGTGPTGTAATATAGTTTTGAPGTSANVTNAGTTSAAVFNFTVPAGAVWRSGSGVPSNAVGLDGDYYLRTGGSAGAGLGDVYLRSSGTYSVVGNLLGPQGIQGNAGVVQAVTAGNGTITIGGTTANPTVAVGTGIPQASVTNLTTDLASKVTGPASAVANRFPTFDGTSGKLIQDSGFQGDTDTTLAANSAARIPTQNAVKTYVDTASALKFDRTNGTLAGVASPTHTAGKLVYDTDNDGLTFFNSDSAVAMQIGQEEWLRVRNVSGSTIVNGAAVYITGTDAGTGLSTIAPAQANSLATSRVVGVATESIANNTTGWITRGGTVRGLVTTGFTAGQKLWLSASNAGQSTNTMPTGTNYRVPVGYIGVVGSGTGTFIVQIDDPSTQATQSVEGWMSTADKKKVDNLWIDVTSNQYANLVGDDSTLNDANMATIIANAPAGSTIYFPSGTYRFAAEITINVDKRLQFLGAGRYISIIKTTSATANIFRKSVAGWYDSWENLGFQSTVTRTAGAAISVDAGNNVGMNCYKLWMTGMFHGINYTGAQSGNLSILSDLDISAVANNGRGIVINGSTINIMIHNTTINAGSATSSACCEINQSGAVQVTGSDWIMGTNVVLFNSTAGAGPQAVYFTNCFFDQPTGSVVKFQGTNTANRIKFTQCGIAPTGNNHAVEITGAGGTVGTSTAHPSGISIVDCDIYNQGGTGTGAGVLVNGCQDINIQNSRITGFNGAGGAGIRIIPSASNQTKVRINGNIFGPNSNLTVTNQVHVEIQAGSSGLGSLSISDNQMEGATSAPLTDASANVLNVSKRISQNSGLTAGLGPMQLLSSGGAAVIAGRGAVTSGTGVTFLFTTRIPANSVQVGTRFRIRVQGQTSAAGVMVYNAYSGAAGTTSDTLACTISQAAQVANGYQTIDLVAEVVALGPTATVVIHGNANGIASATANVAVSAQTAAAEVVANTPTTAAWFLTFAASCSTGTFTVRNAFVEAL